jgi:hypothetical protein
MVFAIFHFKLVKKAFRTRKKISSQKPGFNADFVDAGYKNAPKTS